MKIKFLILLVAIIPAIFRVPNKKPNAKPTSTPTGNLSVPMLKAPNNPLSMMQPGGHSIYRMITVLKIYPQKKA
jgi:hypothetical protein